jgi:pyruvate/2-oxoglutarate dehydrogenase complex dihydrolipoamide dehydrogenase (E3) component
LSVDYDLVVIGTTIAAQQAAIAAVNLKARVALVLPEITNIHPHPHADLYHHALGKMAKTNRPNQLRLNHPASYPWLYAQTAIENLAMQYNPALLAAKGVDTIVGNGEFCRRPKLAFNVNRRYLRASSYLVATGSIPPHRAIPGLKVTGYLTAYNLHTIAPDRIPLRWTIIGEEVIGVELAQTLAYLGCQVKLIVSTPQILPEEDPDIAYLIQAQLEADGVEIYLDSNVIQIERINEEQIIDIGADKIATDIIFLALPERPAIEGLNLVGIGVDYDDKGIGVDRQLRTSHRRVYACGSVCGNIVGGYRGDRVTIYEAEIAVKNALFGEKNRVNYQGLPWAIYTDPPLARMGMSPAEANSYRRGKYQVLKQYFKVTSSAIFDNFPSGLCQIVVNHQGQIFGATIVGANAPDLVQFLTLAVHQRLNITDLLSLPGLSPTYTDIIARTAQEWLTVRANKTGWGSSWRSLCLQWKRKFK